MVPHSKKKEKDAHDNGATREEDTAVDKQRGPFLLQPVAASDNALNGDSIAADIVIEWAQTNKHPKAGPFSCQPR